MKKLKVISMITIIICGLLFLSSEVNSSLGSIDGESYDRNDMFRIQVSNDPFFEDVIVDIENLTYDELIKNNYVIPGGISVNNNMKFWKKVIERENSWDEVEWELWYHVEQDGNVWEREEVRFHTRCMVWL